VLCPVRVIAKPRNGRRHR